MPTPAAVWSAASPRSTAAPAATAATTSSASRPATTRAPGTAPWPRARSASASRCWPRRSRASTRPGSATGGTTRWRSRPPPRSRRWPSFSGRARSPRRRPRGRTDGVGVRLRSLGALLPAGAHPLTTLSLVVPALAAADPGRADLAPEAEMRRARALILRMAALLGFAADPRRARVAVAERQRRPRLPRRPGRHPERARRARGEPGPGPARRSRAPTPPPSPCASPPPPSPISTRASARGWARSPARSTAGAAIGSRPSSPRRSPPAAGPRALLRDRARRGEAVPGFGHALYPDGDPRTPPLLHAALALGPRSAPLRTLLALIDAVRDLGGDAAHRRLRPHRASRWRWGCRPAPPRPSSPSAARPAGSRTCWSSARPASSCARAPATWARRPSCRHPMR